MTSRPKTIFCDIDGTLVEHNPPSVVADPEFKLKLLPKTIEKLQEWDRKGYNIILVTGRKESLRKSTETQLADVGIFYDKLIMGIGGGDRVVINDFKPNSDTPTAVHFCLDRNEGISNVNI
jgi:hypothetical protein